MSFLNWLKMKFVKRYGELHFSIKTDRLIEKIDSLRIPLDTKLKAELLENQTVKGFARFISGKEWNFNSSSSFSWGFPSNELNFYIKQFGDRVTFNITSNGVETILGQIPFSKYLDVIESGNKPVSIFGTDREYFDKVESFKVEINKSSSLMYFEDSDSICIENFITVKYISILNF